jgi:hypothetical protein
MKTITTLFTILFLFACNTAPVIVPDTTTDSISMKRLNYDIEHGDKVSTGWGWILWYLPVVLVILAWTWRKYIKQCPECGNQQPQPVSTSQPETVNTQQSNTPNS